MRREEVDELVAIMRRGNRLLTPEGGRARERAAEGTTVPASEPEAPLLAADSFALPLDAFLATPAGQADALLGTPDDSILPAGGLALFAGQAGVGKTTLALDLAFHLASGIPWLGLDVPRPLRILLVENEGPREPFRRKLERKLAAWPHAIRGALHVAAWRWGELTLTDSDMRARLASSLEEEGIELVIGDPLDSLGLEGVGSPAETRAFLALLRKVGLGRVAFLLLHHLNRSEADDELDRLSGAWPRHPDAVLMVKKAPGDAVRLSFEKLRWAEPREPLILRRLRGSASFELEHDEDEVPLAERIAAFLADGAWRTATEVGKGVRKRRESVEPELERLVASRTVETAVGPEGRARDAVCFRAVVPGSGQAGTTDSGEGAAGCPAGGGALLREPPAGTTPALRLSGDRDEGAA